MEPLGLRGSYWSADKVVGAPVTDLFPSFLGQLYGVEKLPDGNLTSFTMSPDDGKPVPLPGFAIDSVSPLGVAFGAFTQGKEPTASYFNGVAFYDAGIGAGSQALAGDTNIAMAGSYQSQSGQRAFVAYGDKAFDPGDLGGAVGVTAVNQAGNVVGWAMRPAEAPATATSSGTARSSRRSRRRELFESAALGVSDNGLVLVNADNGDGKDGAVYLVDDKGATDLRKVLDKVDFVPLKGLSMTGSGDVVVRGLLDGKPAIVALEEE